MIFTMASNGSIAEVGSLEHDTTLGFHNSLVQVDADTYALAYADDEDRGFIKTFMISSEGHLPVVALKTKRQLAIHCVGAAGHTGSEFKSFAVSLGLVVRLA